MKKRVSARNQITREILKVAKDAMARLDRQSAYAHVEVKRSCAQCDDTYCPSCSRVCPTCSSPHVLPDPKNHDLMGGDRC